MTDDLNQKRFTMKTVYRCISASMVSIAKHLLITAPLTGATIFFGTGLHAQTNESDATNRSVPAIRAITPIDAPEAARTGRPKIKVKEATNGRAENPTPTTSYASTTLVPIEAPEAARTGRPKEKVKEATGRAVNPIPSTTPEKALISPIAAPDAARTGRPKIREKLATGRIANPNSTSEPAIATPITPITVPDTARTGRPKVRDNGPRPPLRVGEPAMQPSPANVEKRRRGPKVRDDGIHDTSRKVAPEAPTAPIEAPESARTGRPKMKVKMATGRVANPTSLTDFPDAEHKGRPKERDDDARDTSRVAKPISTMAPIAPIAVPDANKPGRPKERDKPYWVTTVPNK